ncbi:hypothetical protein NM208_g4785 [Fusarium decemcellulare]|uniref:Uncharacterized protein n=1 Tax=Fusarium decemcellulare TaxID=57161 RepID=A0ACC1SJH8_9HYPO|nr:hypothetical protein NM208_g4785 [Fusarium decemcellulare]
MAGTQKGLPSTHNKDLQESLESMVDHVKTVSDSIQIANGALSTLTVNPEKIKAALDDVGLPRIPINEFSYERIKAIDERFEEDIADVFN